MQRSQPIYTFSDPIEYVTYRLAERRKKNPRYSVSAWARQLGYENSSMLSQVLKRERRLKVDLASRIGADLNLKGRALRYFEALALNAGKSSVERKMVQGLIAQMRPKKFHNLEAISLEVFRTVSDWHHWTIIEMIHLGDFKESVDFIQSRLERKLSKTVIRAALKRLEALGLLSRDDEGRLQRGSGDPVGSLFMRNKVPSEAVQGYHLQMMELARHAVRSQSPDERYLRGTTLPIRRVNLEKANEIIRDAHKRLLELSDTEEADEIYHLSSQFFRLTKKTRVGDRLN
ncbi:MAG: DUF4423 domain-containing protein [Bdellovibrionota bacterium]